MGGFSGMSGDVWVVVGVGGCLLLDAYVFYGGWGGGGRGGLGGGRFMIPVRGSRVLMLCWVHSLPREFFRKDSPLGVFGFGVFRFFGFVEFGFVLFSRLLGVLVFFFGGRGIGFVVRDLFVLSSWFFGWGDVGGIEWWLIVGWGLWVFLGRWWAGGFGCVLVGAFVPVGVLGGFFFFFWGGSLGFLLGRSL